ncbi:helix-turn-helix domain-containing protein [Streptomyces sp. 8L]|uniref:helix-turn-helix domain-containing protein n=1 Tax=Streptomyces sp. 8L TaxID=2877242 RepID=UPI001CD50FC3|nr:helix-turn-helix transcriptional regulator [Streptomyces sp. 8L]MCA1219064.1 helix-turn-helix transcriptional regulator [Streptomyces sp. 8L]
MENTPPPMAWRYCGNQIKRWRERSGVTREALADEASCSYEYVKSMETGRRRPTLHLLRVADGLCEAGGLLLAAQEYLQPEKYVSYAEDFVRYEAEAIAVSSYEPLLIPGLLQTEEMAFALLAADWPPLDDETIQVRVAGRLERQTLLDKATRSYSFVIAEGVLRNPVLPLDGHKRQLLHLLEVGKRRNVMIQVLPAGTASPGLSGSLVLLETPEHDQLAYEEGQLSGMLYADPEKVSFAAQRHAMILRQALSPEESARLIRKLAEEL